MAAVSDTSRPRGTAWRIAIAILVLALLVRLVYLYHISASPTFFTPIIDSCAYHNAAKSLAEDGIMDPTFFWQSFLYPLFLSAVYLPSGSSVVCAKHVQVILGSIVCALVYLLGQKLFDRRTGILAGLVTALYGPLVFLESELLATGWAAFWSVALIWLFQSVVEQGKRRAFFLLGMCGALSVLTRVTFLPFFAAACVWLILSLRRSGMATRPIVAGQALLLGGFLFVAVPSAVQCYRVTGGFNPLPASGPVNLYMGNNPDRTSMMAIRPGADWAELFHIARGGRASATTAEQNRYFMRRFLSYATEQPGRFAVGLLRKAGQFFSSREIPSNTDPYLARRYSWLLSALLWRARGFGFPFGVLLPLSLLGLAVCRRRVPKHIVVLFVFYSGSVVLVFVTGRYRAPLVPILAILASCGVWHLIDQAAARRWRRVTLLLLAAGLVAVLSSVDGPFGAERVNYEAEMYRMLALEYAGHGKMDQALTALRHSLDLEPLNGDAHDALGDVLAREKDFAGARKHYAKALEIDPQRYLGHLKLGNALLDLKEFDLAIEHFRAALQASPRSGPVHHNLGAAFRAKGDHAEAVRHFRKAIEMDPALPAPYYGLANSLLALGEPGEAIQCFEKALRMALAGENQALAAAIRRQLAACKAGEARTPDVQDR